jgi:hypothetical protein
MEILMITVIKVVALGVLALASVSASMAQTKVRRVYISSENAESEPMVSAVKAKIGGTLRYQQSAENNADLWIDILFFKTTIGDRTAGLVCAATYIYWPEDLRSTSIWLSASLHVGPADGIQSAEGIFEDFVNLTSDSNLEKKRTEAISHIRFACLDHKKDEVSLACLGL